MVKVGFIEQADCFKQEERSLQTQRELLVKWIRTNLNVFTGGQKVDNPVKMKQFLEKADSKLLEVKSRSPVPALSMSAIVKP